MRALICGDRDWNDEAIIRTLIVGLLRQDTDLTIIHGGARGADGIAGAQAKWVGAGVREFPAKWHELGKKAGVLRNEQMLREGKPDVVFAFHDFLAESKGTKDMVARARKADIPVYVIARAM